MNMRRTEHAVTLAVGRLTALMILLATPFAGGQEPKPEAVEPAQKDSPSAEKPKAETSVPADHPEPAMEGYCPGAYHLSGSAVKGKPEYKMKYAGEMYWFSGEEAWRAAQEDPDRFLPQFGGLCTTALGGSYGNRRPSDPRVFAIVDGRLYLFGSERAKRAYQRAPQVYIKNATIRFNQPAIDGYCPVTYREQNRATKGHPDISLRYRTSIYYFATVSAKSAFARTPEKYLPQYGGYCAEGMSRGRRYPADPQHFLVYDDRTYLFFDATAALQFQIDTPERIKKADTNWATLRGKE